ncbi:ankyrin repeat-containing domain protein [Aspergillus cavernicola]|uniref:Ankyrin repeat-containing domain protein n=1 Tax=Aspergillus cavernicola TaxID=176166 RepID=A0ABR4HM46_9EURO
MPVSPYPNEQYTVGWVCALTDELVAAMAMMDSEHGNPQTLPKADNNTYVLGSIGNHKVVISCLPWDEQGHISAARVSNDMLHAFPQIRFGLLVGIGGGIPHYDDGNNTTHDIRLGDVVVGCDSQNGGIVRYDFGKRMGDGSFKETYALNRPPRILSSAASKLLAELQMKKCLLSAPLEQMLNNYPHFRDDGYDRPSPSTDRLFKRDYQHISGGKACSKCDKTKEINRKKRGEYAPRVHYGVIASGSQVVKHAPTRDEIRCKHRAICLEMEAAGLMNSFPCLVIRGISDYADSHKNDLWKRYAAATAAAYAKLLLADIDAKDIDSERRAKDLLGEVHNTVVSIDEKVSELKLIAMKGQSARLLQWLSPRNFSAELQDILRRRGRGTGLWFLNSDELQAWLSSNRQTLFCPGIPGAGKTVMAAIVVEHLERIAEHDPAVGLAYLFCRYQPKHVEKVEDMMRILLKQLVLRQVPTHIQQLYDEHAVNDFQLGVPFLSQTLLQTARMYDRVYVVIDALDELYMTDYEEHWRLLTEMSNLQQNASVNLLITSRFDTGIILPFQEVKQKEIRAHKDDLLSYVDERLLHLRVNVHNNLALQEQIRSKIVRAADGMFLLAELHMNDLRDKTSIAHLKQALLTLPQGRAGLPKTYHQAMKMIDQQSGDLQSLARKALSWVAYSRRALSSDELRHALATQPALNDFDKEYLSEIDLIKCACAGLLFWDRETDVIRLVHYTFQDFLRSEQILPNAERDITITCITYLSLHSFSMGRCSNNEEYKMRQKYYPLHNYCTKHWGFHAADAPLSEVTILVLDFFEKAGNVAAASQAMMGPESILPVDFFEPDYLGLIPRGLTTVHIAAHFGLTEILRTLIEAGAEVDALDSMGMTPLLHAAAGKQWPTALFLMEEEGANPRLIDSRSYSLIRLAASAGEESFVKRLLARYTAADPGILEVSIALVSAARNGHISVMKQLIKSGANIDICCYDDDEWCEVTPLQLAVKYGHRAAVSLLLEEGCMLEDLPDDGGDLLCEAARAGNKEIVDLLLNAGISPSLESIEENPLTAAIRGGNMEIISLLLDKNVDVSGEDPSGFTPLMLAVREQNDQATALLIKRGAHLHWCLPNAVEKGSETLVRLLLLKGADPNQMYESIDQTALGMAARMGHMKITNLLLEHGADPNLQDHAMENAIFPAARGGHDALLSLLLSRVANANIGNIIGNTPLFYAVQSSNETAITLLLRAKNDVNQRNELLETPLFVAVRVGHLAIVRLLLENGAEVDSRNLLRETPFLQATRILENKNSTEDSFAVLRLLLEWGAVPNPKSDANHPDLLLELLDIGSRALEERVNGLWKKTQAKIDKARALWSARVRALPEDRFLLFVDNLTQEKIHRLNSSNYERRVWLRGTEGPLTWAIRAGRTEIIDCLIEHSPELEMAYLNDEQSFTYAVVNGHVKLVQRFLQRGVEETSLLNALLRAAENGHTEVIKLLLDTDICGRSPQWYTAGSSAVFHAADRGHTNTVLYLLGKGFSLQHPNEKGKNTLRTAMMEGNHRMMRILLSTGAYCDVKDDFSQTPLCWAARLGLLVTANILLQKRPQLDAVDIDGRTPLFYAVNNGHDSMVKLLLEHDANPDPEDYTRERPILWASGQGYDTILRMLLQRGASVESRADEANSPIFWALKRRSRDRDRNVSTETLLNVTEANAGDYNAVLSILLSHGARVNIRDEAGQTPLFIAVQHRYEASVKLLLQYGEGQISPEHQVYPHS